MASELPLLGAGRSGAVPSPPVIGVLPSSIDVSAGEQQWAVSATNCPDNITVTVTAPAGFDVKKSIGGTYGPTATVTVSNLLQANCKARRTPPLTGDASGTITCTSPGAVEADVAVVYDDML